MTTMAATTEIIARAVIRRDNHLLLARQRGKTWSFLPGGHVEPGEPVEVALIRELVEELGSHATITGLRGVVEHGYLEDGTTHHELNLVFDVTLDIADPASQEDHLEFHWLPEDQIACSGSGLPGGVSRDMPEGCRGRSRSEGWPGSTLSACREPNC